MSNPRIQSRHLAVIALRGRILAALLLSMALAGPARGQAFDHAHASFEQLLKTRVADGLVDYAALKADSTVLDLYLAALGSVSEETFDTWSEAEQMAMLINLYNAATLKLIIGAYPVGSIKSIGTLLRGPWDQPVVPLWGGTVTLNHLEHKIVRVRYAHAPESHFALVCAAKGCPPLRSEAYVPDRLQEQLNDQLRIFMADSAKNSIDLAERRLNLSPIFKWYAEDFEKHAGSVAAYVKAEWPDADASFAIRYTRYDWSLNGR